MQNEIDKIFQQKKRYSNINWNDIGMGVGAVLTGGLNLALLPMINGSSSSSSGTQPEPPPTTPTTTTAGANHTTTGSATTTTAAKPFNWKVLIIVAGGIGVVVVLFIFIAKITK